MSMKFVFYTLYELCLHQYLYRNKTSRMWPAQVADNFDIRKKCAEDKKVIIVLQRITTITRLFMGSITPVVSLFFPYGYILS